MVNEALGSLSRSRSRRVLCASLLLVASASSNAAYVFRSLGTSEMQYSYANGINNAGQVVGSSQFNDGRPRHATVWSGSSIAEYVGNGDISMAWGDNTGSDGFGINGAGSVVGVGTQGSSGVYWGSAMAWGSTANVGGPGPDAPCGCYRTYSQATGINNNDQVVGWSTISGSTRAVSWGPGTFIELGTLGGSTSNANGINDSGWIVGNSSVAGDASSHATLWVGTSAIDLGTLGGSSSSARAINESGWIVGSSSLGTGNLSHATLWIGTTLKDLGSLGTSSWANDVNNVGQIVGGSTTFAGGPSRPVLWSGDSMTDLNSLLDAESVAAGWVLQSATGINDSGSIVGTAFNTLTGESQAYVLAAAVVPEPGAYWLALAGMGVIAVFGATRRQNMQIPSGCAV